MAFLYSVEDDLDLTYFFVFNLRAFRLSIEDLKKYVSRKQKELQKAGVLLKRIPGLNHRQQELINHALHHPTAIYTIERHLLTHGIVYQTARADLLDLIKRKLFVIEKKGRFFRFFPHPELPKKLK